MNRLISEFEVIRAIEKYVDNIFTKSMGDLVKDIKAIPSAEPSRDMEEIAEVIKCDADAETKCKMISNILTAKPHYFEKQEPKTGHWIIIDDCEKFIAKCSECGRIEDSRMISKYPYCHCGAKMVNPQERSE